MRLPGTLKALLEQVKKSPVPLGSISIPTKDGPLMLTFGEVPPAPKPEVPKLVERRPLRERDTVGAFKTPPLAHEEPWQPPADGQ